MISQSIIDEIESFSPINTTEKVDELIIALSAKLNNIFFNSDKLEIQVLENIRKLKIQLYFKQEYSKLTQEHSKLTQEHSKSVQRYNDTVNPIEDVEKLRFDSDCRIFEKEIDNFFRFFNEKKYQKCETCIFGIEEGYKKLTNPKYEYFQKRKWFNDKIKYRYNIFCDNVKTIEILKKEYEITNSHKPWKTSNSEEISSLQKRKLEINKEKEQIIITY